MDNIDKLITIASKGAIRVRKDDDFTDRLHHRFTTSILVVCALIVSMYQYTGKPITCWCPKEFPKTWIKYVSDYCWVRNTYYVPLDATIPKEEEEKHHIVYYQWVPFILLLQTIFFFLPRLVWTTFNTKGGVDSDNVLEAAQLLHKEKDDAVREEKLNEITNKINRFLCFNTIGSEGGLTGRFKRCLACMLCGLCGPRMKCYLNMLYLVTKLTFLANVVVQLILLNHILKTNYTLMGVTALNNLAQNGSFADPVPSTFPKIAFCDFYVRRLGNLHRYTLQCLLQINLFNEKIFIILWFWMVFVMLMTIISFFTWFSRMIMSGDRLNYVRNHVMAFAEVDKDDPTLENFTYSYLQIDGAFLLRLIHHNTNYITVTEIIEELWNKRTGKKKEDADVVASKNRGADSYNPTLQNVRHRNIDAS